MDDVQKGALYEAAVELANATQKADVAAERAKNLAYHTNNRERANLLLTALAEASTELGRAYRRASDLFNQVSTTVANDQELAYPPAKISPGRPDIIAALEDAGIEYTTEYP